MEFLLTLKNGITLPGRVYLPGEKINYVMLLVHGLGDHSGRYMEWSNKFSSEGIAVYAVDLPGHGKAGGRKGHICSYQEYNDIIERLADHVRTEVKDVPVGLYGHSLGGNIVLNYLLTNLYEFQFAIVTSPWLLLVNKPPAVLVAAARVINKVFPGLQISNGLKSEHISRVDKVNQEIVDDPLTHGKISIRLFLEANDAAKRILESGDNINIPVLLAHGSDDLICSADGSRLLAESNDTIELSIFEEGYHELQNEAFNGEVHSFMVDWVKKQ